MRAAIILAGLVAAVNVSAQGTKAPAKPDSTKAPAAKAADTKGAAKAADTKGAAKAPDTKAGAKAPVAAPAPGAKTDVKTDAKTDTKQQPTNPAAGTKQAATPPAAGTKQAATPPAAGTKQAAPPPAVGTKQGAAAPTGTKQAAPQAPAAPQVAPVIIMRETFAYAKESRRDPFASLLTSAELRPTVADLRLTGILFDETGRSSVATMRDLTTNSMYRVMTGQIIGRLRVVLIKRGTVIFSIEEFGENRQDSLVLGDTTKARAK